MNGKAARLWALVASIILLAVLLIWRSAGNEKAPEGPQSPSPKTAAGSPGRSAASEDVVGPAKSARQGTRPPKVVTTESGLKYEVLKAGVGHSPGINDQVKVTYTGWIKGGGELSDGSQGTKPIVLPVSGVVKGWQEGLQLMNVGSKYRFEIPPDLGYGEARTVGEIPAGSTLVFEIELVEIIPVEEVELVEE